MKRAHDIDANLSAHVMHENLVSKASSVLALLNVIHVTGIDRNQVEYVIDCAEEACGDINQRGGGNFAKSAAEIAGLNNASGSDCRRRWWPAALTTPWWSPPAAAPPSWA